MDATVAYEHFRRLKDHRPFQPFEVETEDGKRFMIKRRAGFAMNRKSVVLADANDSARFYSLTAIREIRDGAETSEVQ